VSSTFSSFHEFLPAISAICPNARIFICIPLN
jgi:hypothetical protein